MKSINPLTQYSITSKPYTDFNAINLMMPTPCYISINVIIQGTIKVTCTLTSSFNLYIKKSLNSTQVRPSVMQSQNPSAICLMTIQPLGTPTNISELPVQPADIQITSSSMRQSFTVHLATCDGPDNFSVNLYKEISRNAYNCRYFFFF